MDLDTLKKYTSGNLDPKRFMAVHRDADELMEILFDHLGQNEIVVSVQDWPEPKRRNPAGQFLALKTMMLVTPVIIIGGTAFVSRDPMTVLFSVMVWLALFLSTAGVLLVRRSKRSKSRIGRTVLVITNRRLLRVWLDGTAEVQAWWLRESDPDSRSIDAVSPTIKFLLELELGEVSLN